MYILRDKSGDSRAMVADNIFHQFLTAFDGKLRITAGVVGWIANIVQIFRVDGPLTEAATWTILLAIKVVGIVVPPIGALMGWIGLFA